MIFKMVFENLHQLLFLTVTPEYIMSVGETYFFTAFGQISSGEYVLKQMGEYTIMKKCKAGKDLFLCPLFDASKR